MNQEKILWKEELKKLQCLEEDTAIVKIQHNQRQRSYREILIEIVIGWYINDLKTQKELAFQRLNGKSKKKFSLMNIDELQAMSDLLIAKVKLRKIRKRVLGLHAF